MRTLFTQSLLFTVALSLASAAFAQAVAAPPEEKADQKVQVELIEAGQSPRRAIRFTPEAGTKQTAVMTILMQQQLTMNGAQMPSPKLPAQNMTMAIEITDVAADGDVSLKYEYTDVEVVRGDDTPEQIAAMIEEQTKPMVGTTGTAVMTNRGFTKEAELSVAPGVPAQMQAMMEGMKDSLDKLGAPVPEEEVGVGAKWRVSQEVTANGLTIDQTSVYEITEMTGDTVTLSLTVEQTADEQQVNAPGLPPGASVQLKSLKSSGDGSMVLHTDSIIPVKSQVKIKSANEMEIAAQGQTQAMKVDMTMEMALEMKE